jgi:hypothetical protein
MGAFHTTCLVGPHKFKLPSASSNSIVFNTKKINESFALLNLGTIVQIIED